MWGPELKEDLASLNEYYTGFSEETKAKGVYCFATAPPQDRDSLVTSIWDRQHPRWRETAEPLPTDFPQHDELVSRVMEMAEASEIPPDQVNFDAQSADTVTKKRRVRMRRGSWWQLPKDIDANKND